MVNQKYKQCPWCKGGGCPACNWEGGWCTPLPCHDDVIIDYLQEKKEQGGIHGETKYSHLVS